MKHKLKLLSGALLLALGNGANAADIDLFSTDQAALTLSTAPSTAQSTADTVGTDIIGQERDLYLSMIEDTNAPADDEARISVSGSQLRYANTSGVKSTAQIQWDGNDNNATTGTAGGTLGGIDPNGLDDGVGAAGYDLTAGGTINAFLLETIESDLGYQFAVTIFEADGDADDTNNDWTRILFNATAVPNGTGPVLSTISFAGFATGTPCGATNPPTPLPAGVVSITCETGGDGIDMTKVGAVVVDLNVNGAAASIDLRLANVTTVPEPSVIGLMGVGLFAAGMTGMARRRKSAALAA